MCDPGKVQWDEWKATGPEVKTSTWTDTVGGVRRVDRGGEDGRRNEGRDWCDRRDDRYFRGFVTVSSGRRYETEVLDVLNEEAEEIRRRVHSQVVSRRDWLGMFTG